MAGTRGGNRNIFGRIDFGIPACSMALTPGNHCSLSYNLDLKNLKCSAPFYEAPIRHESCQTTCGDVHTLPTPHLRDCECAANPDDPHTMFIERVEVRKHRPSH